MHKFNLAILMIFLAALFSTEKSVGGELTWTGGGIIFSEQENAVALGFGSAQGVEEYRILRRADAGSKFIEVGTSKIPRYFDKTAVAGVTYHYYVQALLKNYESLETTKKTITVPGVKKDPSLDAVIDISRAGYINSWDNMTYEISISWPTNRSDIDVVAIYGNKVNEDESDLIERVPYRQGGTKYSVIPGRWNSYGLIGETKYRDVFMLHTGWSSVSRDLSEIEFINETLTSIEDTHREFARKALGLGIESSECKEMLLNAIDSGDSVLRAFSLLGLGYARGWNEYITVFEKGVEDDHPLVRWAAISSLYFPKGPIVRPWAPMKKEAICTNLEGLLKDKARMVREKASFILQHRECSENP